MTGKIISIFYPGKIFLYSYSILNHSIEATNPIDIPYSTIEFINGMYFNIHFSQWIRSVSYQYHRVLNSSRLHPSQYFFSFDKNILRCFRYKIFLHRNKTSESKWMIFHVCNHTSICIKFLIWIIKIQ